MADGSIDVLMKVVISGGSVAMDAESLTDVAPFVAGDTLLKDFRNGQFCELTNFDFSAGTEKSLKTKAKEGKTPSDQAAPTQLTNTSRRGELVAQRIAQLEERAAIERAQARRIAHRERDDFVDMREVSYERIMDVASMELFKALTQCTTLASITIVKRKATGDAHSGLGYLRLEFEDVLLTQLDWADKEHIMVENGSFIYRKLTMKYLPQKADGTLSPSISASWKMKTQRAGG